MKIFLNEGIKKKVFGSFSKASKRRALEDKNLYDSFVEKGMLKKLDMNLKIRHENEAGIETSSTFEKKERNFKRNKNNKKDE